MRTLKGINSRGLSAIHPVCEQADDPPRGGINSADAVLLNGYELLAGHRLQGLQDTARRTHDLGEAMLAGH